jgi:hypothetical protein
MRQEIILLKMNKIQTKTIIKAKLLILDKKHLLIEHHQQDLIRN